jgi:hypothetical protein
MKEKELQLVSYEQAKQLKALGFNWVKNPCYEEGREELDHYPILTKQSNHVDFGRKMSSRTGERDYTIRNTAVECDKL